SRRRSRHNLAGRSSGRGSRSGPRVRPGRGRGAAPLLESPAANSASRVPRRRPRTCGPLLRGAACSRGWGRRSPGHNTAMHGRACRECGEEYRPEILLCTDCGGTLEDRDDELEPPPRPELAAPSLATPSEGTSLAREPFRWLQRTETAAEMDPLAQRLGAGRI